MDRIKTATLIALVIVTWAIGFLAARASAQTLIVPMPDSWASPAPTIAPAPPPPPVIVIPSTGSSTICSTFGSLTYCTN